MSVLEAMGPLGFTTIVEAVANENVVIAGPMSGKRIRGLCAVLSSVGGCIVNFHQGAGSASGNLVISANTTINIPPCVFGWGDTDVGSPLLMNCTGDVQGFVRYQTID